ncbi:hypothetical protein AGMMS49992_18100 [Clostridia bacterium]|nr:hypothetical protein AGMMS49992_18100 [Clostridia bacterium]
MINGIAYGKLAVRYNSNDIEHAANRLNSAYTKVNDDLIHIRSRLLMIPENQADNIASASAFIQKKKQQFGDSADAVSVFTGKVNAFLSEAKNVDNEVHYNINAAYKEFHKVTGIGISTAAFWSKQIWEGLAVIAVIAVAVIALHFGGLVALMLVAVAVYITYELLPEGSLKYKFKILSSAAALIVSVLSLPVTGPLAIVGSIVGIFTAAIKLYRDVTAYIMYESGHKAIAYNIREMTGGQYFATLCDIAGWHNVEFAENLYNGIAVIGALCSFADFAKTSIQGIKKIGSLKDFANYRQYFTNKINGEIGDMINLHKDVMSKGIIGGLKLDDFDKFIKNIKIIKDLWEGAYDLSQLTPKFRKGVYIKPIIDVIGDIPLVDDFYKPIDKGNTLIKGVTNPVPDPFIQKAKDLKHIIIPKLNIPQLPKLSLAAG